MRLPLAFMSRLAAGLRSGGWPRLALVIGLLCALVPAAHAHLSTIRISEIFVDPAGANDTQTIELFNAGPVPVSLNGAVIASDDQTSTLSGLADVPPGGTVVVHWNQSGTSGSGPSATGNQFFTGETVELDPSQGNVALFKSDALTRASEMVAYVQWGAPDQAHADLAGQVALWDPSAFLSPAPEGRSMALLPGGTGRSPTEWATSAPTIGAPGTAPARGYRGWALVGGQSTQAPSILFTSGADLLELVSVVAGGTFQHRRFLNDAWRLTADLGGTFTLPPALVAGAGGTLELVGVAADQQVLHNRFLSGQLASFVPTGGQSALPPALAFDPGANTAELVIVGADNQLLHSRFANGQWSAFSPVGSRSGTGPSLVLNPQGSIRELLFSGLDRTLFHSRLSGSAWSAPVSTATQTALRPALVALPDGSLDAAITALDGSVLQNRFQNGAWRGWQPISGLQSDLPPTLVYSPESNTTELFSVGRDRQVRQARRTTAGWSAGVPTGAVAAFSVAAAAGVGGPVEVVVTGQDGNLWHNRFQAQTPPEVSFANAIQPIFDARCSCHQDDFPQAGVSLRAGEAYDSIVGVPSGQTDLNLVEPGDPTKSYLFHKISGTQRSVGGNGNRMPSSGGRLSDAQIALIRQWIEQGAQNN